MIIYVGANKHNIFLSQIIFYSIDLMKVNEDLYDTEKILCYFIWNAVQFE